ncbi:MAG: BamA/TamA family outer membrane protein, partial [Synergistaceae bacterium]|nr:BamA/TamA family outer membrane protein [Synergistaceae bacterium]
RISRRDEVATIDVDVLQSEGGTSDDVDLLFSVEKRSPYEIGLDGYTTNFSTHRRISVMFNARDIASDGDSGNVEARYGNNEWGAALRYFTPMSNYSQWGFSISARRDDLSPEGFDPYQLERFSARALYYRESSDRRVGFGLAAERSDSMGRDSDVWGPYLYFNKDTLDDHLNPTSGYSVNSQVWWNTADIWVTRSELSAFIPLFGKNHIVLNLGLETGDMSDRAYRALLGDQEELYSLARHPLAGDQSAWARLGFGRNFYTSWWGSIRGEVFATYGTVMENWSNIDEAWEAGLALSVPGQLFNGSLVLIYDDGGEFSVGFTIGIPRWAPSPLP